MRWNGYVSPSRSMGGPSTTSGVSPRRTKGSRESAGEDGRRQLGGCTGSRSGRSWACWEWATSLTRRSPSGAIPGGRCRRGCCRWFRRR